MQSRGFSLLEVLVALVVLSIGLLGIAALHVEGVRSGQTALQRTRAVNLAADMIDRIRANPAGADVYAAAGMAGPGAPPNPLCADDPNGEAGRDCTPDEMATHDIWQWRETLGGRTATALPGGNGGIARNEATDPDTFVVTVQWTEKGQQNSYALSVQP